VGLLILVGVISETFTTLSGDMPFRRENSWRRKVDRHELPERFGDLLEFVYAFTDPIILESSTIETHWDPVKDVWR
jgi:hypothetical protein